MYTEDDVLDALEDIDVEPTEENIERAIQAIESDGLYEVQQFLNETIHEVVEDEFCN